MVGETGGKKQRLPLQTKPEYVRTRFKKGVDVKHDKKIIPIIHLHKTKKNCDQKDHLPAQKKRWKRRKRTAA